MLEIWQRGWNRLSWFMETNPFQLYLRHQEYLRASSLESQVQFYFFEWLTSTFRLSSKLLIKLTMCPFEKYLTNMGIFTGAVRRAVALGRFLQNPVALVASLCRPPLESMEVLSIKLHPLQGFLSKEELYDIIERVMVTVVNQVIQFRVVRFYILSLYQWL